MTEDLYDKMRKELWNSAFHSYGTAYIYGQRAKAIEKRLTLITFLGIVVPIIVGGIVTSYGTESSVLKYAIIAAAPLSLIQLIISVWSIVDKWNEKSSYFLESQIDNFSYSDRFQSLAKFPPQTYEELKTETEKIGLQKQNRDIQDSKYSLTDAEKRKGMRFALRKFRRECTGCNQIPKSMESTDCDICGKF